MADQDASLADLLRGRLFQVPALSGARANNALMPQSREEREELARDANSAVVGATALPFMLTPMGAGATALGAALSPSPAGANSGEYQPPGTFDVNPRTLQIGAGLGTALHFMGRSTLHPLIRAPMSALGLGVAGHGAAGWGHDLRQLHDHYADRERNGQR